MTDKDKPNYYNIDEKKKILKAYLGSLFFSMEKTSKNRYNLIKGRFKNLSPPFTKLIICKDQTYLKISASYILTTILGWPSYEIIDVDSLMNTWLGYEVGHSKETIKSIDTLVILSFGNSFFKNTKGLIESVVLKRQFDNLNTIVLTTSRDKNIVSVFKEADIIEFRG